MAERIYRRSTRISAALGRREAGTAGSYRAWAAISPVRPCPEHGGGGGAVGAHRRHQKLRRSFFHAGGQLLSNAAPLGVDDE